MIENPLTEETLNLKCPHCGTQPLDTYEKLTYHRAEDNSLEEVTIRLYCKTCGCALSLEDLKENPPNIAEARRLSRLPGEV